MLSGNGKKELFVCIISKLFKNLYILYDNLYKLC